MTLPFDLTTYAPLERPSTEALNRGASTQRQTLQFLLAQQYAQRFAIDNPRASLRTGFIGDGYMVRPVNPAAMQVEVAAGLGFLYDPTQPLVAAQDFIVGTYQGITDTSSLRPMVLSESVTIDVLPPPLAGQSRIDIIEVRPKRELADYETKLRYNPGAGAFQPMSAAEALRYAVEQTEVGAVASPASSTAPVSYKSGTPAVSGTEVEPPTTPGYVKIARLLVSDATTTITDAKIVNTRALLFDIGLGFVCGRATIQTIRNDFVKPVITSLVAPPGVRVAVFYRNKIPATGFHVRPTTLIFTGASVRNFTGGYQLVNFPIVPTTNEEPFVTHDVTATKNRIVQVSDIDSGELSDPNLTWPAGGYATGSVFSSLNGLFCAWNPATQLWDKDISAFNPLEFAFWAAFSY